MIKKLTIAFVMLLLAITASAELLTPVKWTSEVKMSDEANGEMIFTATIEDGWHMYAMNLPSGGPTPLSVTWEATEGITLDGELTPEVAPHEQVDMVFHMKLGWWSSGVTLKQKFTVNKPTYNIEGYLKYMVCNDVTCQSPAKEPFHFKGVAKAATPIFAETDSAPALTAGTPTAEVDTTLSGIWAPVDESSSNAAGGTTSNSGSHSFWYIFLGGFLGGLLALLTPCVWPMIPLTVSFFLKKNTSRVNSVRDAMIYGFSIIVIYLLLGLIITAMFGASSLNALSTNAIFNIIFFLMLVVFAISFFGAFDIKLPDSWANKMDSKAEKTTGILSIFFMAFTLTLVSFSCTGPIIGTLLVEAASMGNFTGPAIGMAGFAIALAVPFTIFAVFPSWLKEMPKSGGWLNSVKVVLGFIELALSLKFLSVADLAYGWGILDRETFIALWVVIFALLGMYLLGKLRFAHDSEVKGIGVFRFFLALISLSFAVYLIPGLWGAPLKSVSAFVPPLYTQDFNLYGGGFSEYDDYDEGMLNSAGKPILVDFSGYGCVNCRKMEAAVFDNSRVRKVIEDNFVMIKLMVDDKKALPEPVYVKENGKKVKLETYGDRWSYLQRHKFGANSQPYYVVLDSEGKLMSGPYYYDEDIDKFIEFLNKGKENFNK